MSRAPRLRKRPGQRRSQMTFDAIVEAGARIFVDEGYAGLTTNKVADLAGVSIGSLYQYFEDKDSLVYAIHERHQQRVRAAMSGSFEVSGDLASYDHIRNIIASVIKAHAVEPKLHARLEGLRREGLFPLALGESELSQIARKLEEMLFTLKGRTIEDPHLSALMLVTTVHALIEAFERSDTSYPTDTQIDEVTRMVFGYMTVGQSFPKVDDGAIGVG